jgi:hypothetical protein
MVKITAFIDAHEVEISASGTVETDIRWMLVRPPQDYEIASVISSSVLKVTSDELLPVSDGYFDWTIRQKKLTISEIPGGILVPSLEGTIEVQSDEVHIGGCTDFFVRGTSLEEAELTVNSLADEDPLLDHLTLSTTASDEWVTDPQVTNWIEEGVLPGCSLIIDAGPNAGTYTVLKVKSSDYSQLQIYPAPSSTVAAQRYRIIDDIDVDLRNPRAMRGFGSDLQTLQLNDEVTTTAAVDFLALGTGPV